MKVAIVTTMWQRPEIFRIFATQCQHLKEKYGNLELIVTGSESHKSKALAVEYGFHYIEQANKPLGKKQNKSVLKAKQLDVDYVICVGSDDLITDKLYEYYLERFKEGFDYIAPLDCYFIDYNTNKGLYWGGYRDSRKGVACGAGRCLSKYALNKLGWQPWYDELYSNMLDTGFDEKLKRIPHTRHMFFLKGTKNFLIDIKSDVNMTPFAKWDNSLFYNSKTLLNKLPENVKRLFKEIS